MIKTKVSTLLHDRPVIVLKQETTVELALQARHCFWLLLTWINALANSHVIATEQPPLTVQTLAGRMILSAPVISAPEGVDPHSFATNSPGQEVACFVDIRDVSFTIVFVLCQACACTPRSGLPEETSTGESDKSFTCVLQILVSFLEGGGTLKLIVCLAKRYHKIETAYRCQALSLLGCRAG